MTSRPADGAGIPSPDTNPVPFGIPVVEACPVPGGGPGPGGGTGLLRRHACFHLAPCFVLRLISFLLSLQAVQPADGQERQRIAYRPPMAVEAGACLDWCLSAREDGAENGAAVDATLSFDIGLGDRWSFLLSFPAVAEFSSATGSVRAAQGDLSIGAGMTGRRASLRWGADVEWTVPSGESSPWRIRDGSLPSGSGTQRFGAGLSLSLIRDPVVLSFSVGADTSLPQAVPAGRLWRAGELRASFGLHEALNDEVSWSISATPIAILPSFANGSWTSRGPSWNVSVAVQAGWYPGPFTFRSGVQSAGGGAWAWLASAGVRKEWERD